MMNSRDEPKIRSLNQAALTRHGDGGNGPHREMPQDGLMREHHTGNRRVEPRRDGAATPQPIKTSVVRTPPVTCRRKLPIVAPKCTSGPYCPTEAPPLAEMKAASVEPNPISHQAHCRCGARRKCCLPARASGKSRRACAPAGSGQRREQGSAAARRTARRPPTDIMPKLMPSRCSVSHLTPITKPFETIDITSPKPTPQSTPPR